MRQGYCWYLSISLLAPSIFFVVVIFSFERQAARFHFRELDPDNVDIVITRGREGAGAGVVVMALLRKTSHGCRQILKFRVQGFRKVGKVGKVGSFLLFGIVRLVGIFRDHL